MDRYKGTFNWYGEIMVLWTHANTDVTARTNLFKQVANKVGFTYAFVSRYFVTSKGTYKIAKE
jgi:hypothetical protein